MTTKGPWTALMQEADITSYAGGVGVLVHQLHVVHELFAAHEEVVAVGAVDGVRSANVDCVLCGKRVNTIMRKAH